MCRDMVTAQSPSCNLYFCDISINCVFLICINFQYHGPKGCLPNNTSIRSISQVAVWPVESGKVSFCHKNSVRTQDVYDNGYAAAFYTAPVYTFQATSYLTWIEDFRICTHFNMCMTTVLKLLLSCAGLCSLDHYHRTDNGKMGNEKIFRKHPNDCQSVFTVFTQSLKRFEKWIKKLLVKQNHEALFLANFMDR